MSGSVENLIAYRLSRADESLTDARVLLSAGSLHGAVNRLYYACFYAVSALMLQRDLSSSKHSGVLSVFNRQFVKGGLVDEADGQLYNNLYADRGRGDYQDHIVFDRAKVAEWSEQAGLFVAHLKALIDSA